jgi:hypothetical protein
MEDFTNATPAEKVEAVLAVLREPCSRELVCKFAGVDPATIDEDAARSLEEVFRKWEVRQEPESQAPRYWVPMEEQIAVLARIGLETSSVRDRIINCGRAKYGRKKRT